MSELTDLYQEVILDHNKSPRNFGAIEDADRTADGHNPLCGDQLRVYLVLDGEIVRGHQVRGVGVCDLEGFGFTDDGGGEGEDGGGGGGALQGIPRSDDGDPAVRAQAGAELGKLAVFEGVREFPVRVKCATLSWHTLEAALGLDNLDRLY